MFKGETERLIRKQTVQIENGTFECKMVRSVQRQNVQNTNETYISLAIHKSIKINFSNNQMSTRFSQP